MTFSNIPFIRWHLFICYPLPCLSFPPFSSHFIFSPSPSPLHWFGTIPRITVSPIFNFLSRCLLPLVLHLFTFSFISFFISSSKYFQVILCDIAIPSFSLHASTFPPHPYCLQLFAVSSSITGSHFSPYHHDSFIYSSHTWPFKSTNRLTHSSTTCASLILVINRI